MKRCNDIEEKRQTERNLRARALFNTKRSEGLHKRGARGTRFRRRGRKFMLENNPRCAPSEARAGFATTNAPDDKSTTNYRPAITSGTKPPQIIRINFTINLATPLGSITQPKTKNTFPTSVVKSAHSHFRRTHPPLSTSVPNCGLDLSPRTLPKQELPGTRFCCPGLPRRTFFQAFLVELPPLLPPIARNC